MSEWNSALKAAVRILEHRQNRLQDIEVGYHQYAPDPAYATLNSVIELLEDLMEEDE